jgi:hypothetical protein
MSFQNFKSHIEFMKFCQNHWSLMSKLLKKPSALKREHTALQNMKILYFFLYLWVIFALMDPDPATQINADLDPQPPVAMHSCFLDEGLRAAQGSPAQPAGAGGGEGAGEDGGRPPADEEVHRGNERDKSASGAGTVAPCSDHARDQCCGSALVSMRFRKQIRIGFNAVPVQIRIGFSAVPDTDPDADPDPVFFVNADPNTILDPH